jgi:hypothetical protein
LNASAKADRDTSVCVRQFGSVFLEKSQGHSRVSKVQNQPTSTYFSKNAEPMRYDRFRAQGYLIGSGTIESGCKPLETLRGTKWTLDGAIQTAKARAAWLSGERDDLYAIRASLPLSTDKLCMHIC